MFVFVCVCVCVSPSVCLCVCVCVSCLSVCLSVCLRWLSNSEPTYVKNYFFLHGLCLWSLWTLRCEGRSSINLYPCDLTFCGCLHSLTAVGFPFEFALMLASSSEEKYFVVVSKSWRMQRRVPCQSARLIAMHSHLRSVAYILNIHAHMHTTQAGGVDCLDNQGNQGNLQNPM